MKKKKIQELKSKIQELEFENNELKSDIWANVDELTRRVHIVEVSFMSLCAIVFAIILYLGG